MCTSLEETKTKISTHSIKIERKPRWVQLVARIQFGFKLNELRFCKTLYDLYAGAQNPAEVTSQSLVPVHSSLASLVNQDDKASTSTGPSPHRRYHFSPMQTMELNNAFSQNPYPSVKYRQELATRLGIDQKVRQLHPKPRLYLSLFDWNHISNRIFRRYNYQLRIQFINGSLEGGSFTLSPSILHTTVFDTFVLHSETRTHSFSRSLCTLWQIEKLS